VAVAAIIVTGLAVSLAAGVLWHRSVHNSEHQAFTIAATDVSETTQMLLQQESDFLTGLRTTLTQEPNLNASEFSRWLEELETKQPQVGGLGSLVVRSVPAAELKGFLAARDRDPAFLRLVGGDVTAVTGTRARRCLLAAGNTSVPYTREVSELVQADWCDPHSEMGSFSDGDETESQLMSQLAESGELGVYPVTAQGLTTSFFETAFYRVGAPLKTVAERRAAVLGWVSSSFSVQALARTALEPHTHLSIALYHSERGRPLVHIGGAGNVRHPRFTSSTSFQLAGKWVVRIAGAEPGPAISAGLQALLLALVGTLLTGMLAMLVLTLGRSCARALGMVDQKTGELRHQTLHDSLTGLPNRVLALDRAAHMLARARREQTPVAALYLNLDGFKQVNDTFGHRVGDEVLQTVAERLRSVVREGDTVARVGGDEFVVLIEGAALDAGVEVVAERVLDVLRQPYGVQGRHGRELSLGASIGIATGVRLSADELLRDADLALYEAKTAGRNRYVVFQSAMHVAAQERAELEIDLADAIERGELVLLYQPTIDLDSERMTGAEALIRWRHPQRGMLSPDRFIPLAEETGLIVPLGAWVLMEACRQAAAWHAAGHPIGIAVNVSVRQLETRGVLDDVSRALTASGLKAESLTLEVTETALMRDPETTAARLCELKQLGVRIAIDDFGTGYSSLAYLRQFPADCLKIDRSFVNTIADSQQSTAIIRTLVQLGKALHIETLAEGIENSYQLHALQQEHCDQGQGFLFARPLPVEGIEALLGSSIMLSGEQTIAT
jgi:diguanylate cyclase (GGDEF)-like protein